MRPGSLKITHARTEDGADKAGTVRPELPGDERAIRVAGKDVRSRCVAIEVARDR